MLEKKKHSKLKSRCTLFFKKQKMRQRTKNVGRKPRQFAEEKACFLSFTALKGSRVIPRTLFAVNPLENLNRAEGKEDQSRGVRNRSKIFTTLLQPISREFIFHSKLSGGDATDSFFRSCSNLISIVLTTTSPATRKEQPGVVNN